MTKNSIVIITGLSGAGKSNALRFFEDNGYYCIDNMPPELLESVIRFILGSENSITRFAVAVDIRSGDFFGKFKESIDKLSEASDVELRTLFLDADDDELVRRYKETRRRHPLDDESGGNLYKAIAMERQATLGAKEMADYYIDTTSSSIAAFKQRMTALFRGEESNMLVSIISFGYKYGIPKDADLVFDVRCLPNPFYVIELKQKTGLDDEVYRYVMNCPEADEIFERISSLIEYLLPLYIKEGKTGLVVAFGCTGGKHRSVSFARRLSEYLSKKGGNIRTEHRHINM